MSLLEDRWPRLLGLLCVILAGFSVPRAHDGPNRTSAGKGFDSGFSPTEFSVGKEPNGVRHSWIRYRGDWGSAKVTARALAMKSALAADPVSPPRGIALSLSRDWRTGVRRASPWSRVPLDLREAFARATSWGRAFGMQHLAWEIENEPELIYISENPENYAAYFKTISLGLESGLLRTGGWSMPDAKISSSRQRVLMAPMGLPPGPVFQALLDNGLLSYTDGFNFHSYGYAADFTGVYRMFEAAVADNSRQAKTSDSRPVIRKSLPIFLTEYGYGLMSGIAAKTTQGRVRQWRHFREVYPQIQALQIEAPAAFYLRPYFEQDSREYGLTFAPSHQKQVSQDQPPALGDPSQTKGLFVAGDIEFRPSDFGAVEVESWMKDIGRTIGGNEASPALAWLMNQTGVTQSRPWVVHAERPSPVVIDFVAGADMWAAKWYRGHFLQTQAGEGYSGDGELRIYNFHHASVAGVLRVWGARDAESSQRLEIKAGDRAIVPLGFWASADRFRGHRWQAEFLPDDRRLARSIFSSWNYPNYGAMRERWVENFSAAGEQTRVNAAFLDSRPQADDEERLSPQGRWRVSKGVRVEEDGDVWRFIVTGFPDEPLRPAAAELPLREGFRFTPDSLFAADYRLRVRTIERVEPALEPRAERVFSALDREPIGIYVRSKTGNVFTMSGHWAATTEWQPYMQAAANLNLFPFGRTVMPWRFLQHEPAALVFHFRPRLLPAVYEVRNARVVEFTSGE